MFADTDLLLKLNLQYMSKKLFNQIIPPMLQKFLTPDFLEILFWYD